MIKLQIALKRIAKIFSENQEVFLMDQKRIGILA